MQQKKKSMRVQCNTNRFHGSRKRKSQQTSREDFPSTFNQFVIYQILPFQGKYDLKMRPETLIYFDEVSMTKGLQASRRTKHLQKINKK